MQEKQVDTLIAEKIMGWKIKNILTSNYGNQADVWVNEADEIMAFDREWKPSTNIDDAWQVVERLVDKGFDVSVSRMVNWRVPYECYVTKENWIEDERIVIGEKTGPLAICLAALKTVEK